MIECSYGKKFPELVLYLDGNVWVDSFDVQRGRIWRNRKSGEIQTSKPDLSTFKNPKMHVPLPTRPFIYSSKNGSWSSTTFENGDEDYFDELAVDGHQEDRPRDATANIQTDGGKQLSDACPAIGGTKRVSVSMDARILAQAMNDLPTQFNSSPTKVVVVGSPISNSSTLESPTASSSDNCGANENRNSQTYRQASTVTDPSTATLQSVPFQQAYLAASSGTSSSTNSSTQATAVDAAEQERKAKKLHQMGSIFVKTPMLQAGGARSIKSPGLGSGSRGSVDISASSNPTQSQAPPSEQLPDPWNVSLPPPELAPVSSYPTVRPLNTASSVVLDQAATPSPAAPASSAKSATVVLNPPAPISASHGALPTPTKVTHWPPTPSSPLTTSSPPKSPSKLAAWPPPKPTPTTSPRTTSSPPKPLPLAKQSAFNQFLFEQQSSDTFPSTTPTVILPKPAGSPSTSWALQEPQQSQSDSPVSSPSVSPSVSRSRPASKVNPERSPSESPKNRARGDDEASQCTVEENDDGDEEPPEVVVIRERAVQSQRIVGGIGGIDPDIRLRLLLNQNSINGGSGTTMDAATKNKEYFKLLKAQEEEQKRAKEAEGGTDAASVQARRDAEAAAQSHEKDKTKHYAKLGSTFAIKGNALAGRAKQGSITPKRGAEM